MAGWPSRPLDAVGADDAYAAGDCLVSFKLKPSVLLTFECRKPAIGAEKSLSRTPGRKPWIVARRCPRSMRKLDVKCKLGCKDVGMSHPTCSPPQHPNFKFIVRCATIPYPVRHERSCLKTFWLWSTSLAMPIS